MRLRSIGGVVRGIRRISPVFLVLFLVPGVIASSGDAADRPGDLVGWDLRSGESLTINPSPDSVGGLIAGWRPPDLPEAEETAGLRGKVFGLDDRIKVSATASYPWSAVCKLFVTFQDGYQVVASGVMIGVRRP